MSEDFQQGDSARRPAGAEHQESGGPLHASDELVRGILDSSLDGIVALRSVRDEAGAIVDFEWLLLNRQAQRLLGEASAHFVGRRLLETLPGNRELGLFDAYVRVVETGEPAENVFHYDYDGIRAWHQNVAVKLGDGFMVTFRDITRAKEEEQVREALTAAQLGTFEYQFRTGTLVTSPGMAAIYGLDASSEPRTAREFLAHVHPDDRGEVGGILQELAEGREVEFRIIRADGTLRWVQARAQVLGATQGLPERVLGVVIDITERKRTEEERDALFRDLELERSRLETVFREAPAAIATMRGPEHVFEMVNPVYRQLVGGREVIGKPVREALPEVERQGFTELLDRVRETGEPYVGRRTRLLLEGPGGAGPQEHFVDFVYLPLRDADGTVSGIFAHGVDVTEHRRAVEALARAREEMERRVEERTAELTALNDELESFNYSVSHDLRAPLRGIDGFSQALLEEYSGGMDDTARHYLERVRASAKRMGDLIDDLLNLSRLSRAPRRLQEVDLSELAHGVVAELRDGEPERQVQVTIQPGVTVTGDRGLLRVVLENLLGNAWKFTHRRGDAARIEFGVSEEDGEAVYFVRDNGAGFDMRYEAKLFAPFQRLHSPSEFAGTGIGLAIVQRILRQHGGRIWARSEPDRGAVFYFTLARRQQRT